MTGPTEKNLLLAHDMMWPADSHASPEDKLKWVRHTPVYIAIAHHLDERDAADAQREAEVGRVVDLIDHELERVGFSEGSWQRMDLRSLIRAKPEPDTALWEEFLRARFPDWTDERLRYEVVSDYIALDKLGLELVRKGDEA